MRTVGAAYAPVGVGELDPGLAQALARSWVWLVPPDARRVANWHLGIEGGDNLSQVRRRSARGCADPRSLRRPQPERDMIAPTDASEPKIHVLVQSLE